MYLPNKKNTVLLYLMELHIPTQTGFTGHSSNKDTMKRTKDIHQNDLIHNKEKDLIW